MTCWCLLSSEMKSPTLSSDILLICWIPPPSSSSLLRPRYDLHSRLLHFILLDPSHYSIVLRLWMILILLFKSFIHSSFIYLFIQTYFCKVFKIKINKNRNKKSVWGQRKKQIFQFLELIYVPRLSTCSLHLSFPLKGRITFLFCVPSAVGREQFPCTDFLKLKYTWHLKSNHLIHVNVHCKL